MVSDEATSSLDTDTEKNVKKTLSTLRKVEQPLIIAHRLSTISVADLIIVSSTRKNCRNRKTRSIGFSKMGERYAAMWMKQTRSGRAESGVAEDSLTCDGVAVSNQS